MVTIAARASCFLQTVRLSLSLSLDISKSDRAKSKPAFSHTFLQMATGGLGGELITLSCSSLSKPSPRKSVQR